MVALLFIGIICCVVALFKGYYLYLIEKKGRTSSAIILNYQLDFVGNIIPVIEFSSEGRTIRSRPFYFSLTRLFNSRIFREMTNNKLNVAYWPDNPEKFILLEENKTYYHFKILFWIFMGILISAFSISAMVFI